MLLPMRIPSKWSESESQVEVDGVDEVDEVDVSQAVMHHIPDARKITDIGAELRRTLLNH